MSYHHEAYAIVREINGSVKDSSIAVTDGRFEIYYQPRHAYEALPSLERSNPGETFRVIQTKIQIPWRL